MPKNEVKQEHSLTRKVLNVREISLFCKLSHRIVHFFRECLHLSLQLSKSARMTSLTSNIAAGSN